MGLGSSLRYAYDLAGILSASNHRVTSERHAHHLSQSGRQRGTEGERSVVEQRTSTVGHHIASVRKDHQVASVRREVMIGQQVDDTASTAPDAEQRMIPRPSAMMRSPW